MKRKISVLHVIASLDKNAGGTSSAVPNQCKATAVAGLEVGISYVWKGEKLSPEADLLNLQKVKTLPVKSLYRGWDLWGYISRYDIIHVDGIWSPYCHLGAWFARLQKKPLVITLHGMLEPWALNAKKTKKRIAYRLYQEKDLARAAVLQATALEEAKHLRTLGIRTPVAVIPNGVIIPRFRGKAGESGKKRRLLFLSRVHPKKGVLELVRAVASLRQIFLHGKWVVTIAGPDEGGHLAVVKKEARKLSVENLIEYPGSVEGDEKWDLYRSSSLFILPTYSENFGLVVAEALGCGIPVITTNGAPWEELNSRKCGWWYPIGQKELVSTLCRALTTPPRALREMGKRGEKLVHQKYMWPSIGCQLKETYEWILKVGPRPPFTMNWEFDGF